MTKELKEELVDMWKGILKYSAITAFGETFKPNKITDSKLPAVIKIYGDDSSVFGDSNKLVLKENYQTVQEAWNYLQKLAKDVRFTIQGHDGSGKLVGQKNPNIKLTYWIEESGQRFNRKQDGLKNQI